LTSLSWYDSRESADAVGRLDEEGRTGAEVGREVVPNFESVRLARFEFDGCSPLRRPDVVEQLAGVEALDILNDASIVEEEGGMAD
jgi:hypothetical protein